MLSDVDEEDEDFSVTSKRNVADGTHNDDVENFHLNVVYIYFTTYSVFITNKYKKDGDVNVCWMKTLRNSINQSKAKCLEISTTGFLSFLSLLVVNSIFRTIRKIPKNSNWIFLLIYLNVYSTSKYISKLSSQQIDVTCSEIFDEHVLLSTSSMFSGLSREKIAARFTGLIQYLGETSLERVRSLTAQLWINIDANY